MTLQECITLLQRFTAYDLDNSAGSASGAVTDADATAQINYGIRTVSKYIRQYSPKVVFTVVANQPNYDTHSTTPFASKMLEVKRVIINGSNLLSASGRRYGLWTVQEVERQHPSWITDAANTPTKAFQVGNELWLHPKPTAATLSSGNNFVGGVYMAPNLDSVTDLSNSPGVPEELHEAVVRIAADFAADPSVTESEGIARLQRYQAKAFDAMEQVRKRNAKLARSWGSTAGNEPSGVIRL